MPIWGSNRANNVQRTERRNSNLISALYKTNVDDGSLPLLNELSKRNVVFTGFTGLPDTIINGNIVVTGANYVHGPSGYLMDVSGDLT